MRTVLRAAIVILVLAIAGILWASRAGEKGSIRPDVPTARAIRVLPPDSVITGPVDAEHKVRGYDIRLVRDTAAGDQIVDITRNSHRVFAVRSTNIDLDSVGVDITGDRIPDLIVQAFTGGMHCCTQATVLSLGDTLSVLGTINGADGEVEFYDPDDDGILEVKVGDYRFAYWREYAFVETQVPEVILRFRHGGYEPACDLMAEDAPSQATLDRRARELTDGWTAGDPPAGFWGYAVDLIYAGHADIAWRWLDRAWPQNIEGKAEFISDLRETLRGSPCWSPAPTARPIG